jgi:sporulation protein YlmC with PRC-barrel domain
MHKRILVTASFIALSSNIPAIAADVHAKSETAVETKTTGDVKTDAKEAWKNIKEDSAEAYEKIKAVLIDEDEMTALDPVVIDSRHTASGIIGRHVYNEKKERVATVKDIIVDADGNARMLVLADSEFPGFDGKLAAFDYDIFSRQDAEGDVIAPISESNIDKAAEFSYDLEKAYGTKMRIIPQNGFSVAKLLDGQLINSKGESVAEIENISFKAGHASQLIVGFDKVMGMGGKSAVLNYDKAKLVHNGDDLDFKLSDAHAAQFEAYKKTAAN